MTHLTALSIISGILPSNVVSIILSLSSDYKSFVWSTSATHFKRGGVLRIFDFVPFLPSKCLHRSPRKACAKSGVARPNVITHRLMGEGNAVNIRQPRLKNTTWEATKRAYRRIITQEERDSGYLPATFQADILSY